MRKQIIPQLSVAEKITLTLAIGWNVATMVVMVYGRRPDWGLLMITPYALFTLMYCDSDNSPEIYETED
jgi:hypothetical protein